MKATELAGKWVHRTERAVKNDGSYMSTPVFVLKVDNGIYYVSDIQGTRVRFLSREWLDGSWALWPVDLETPKVALSKGGNMNFKKRSEMCGPGKKDTGTVFSGDIRGGTVFSGSPVYCDRGVFMKVNSVHGGFVGLAYSTGSRCNGVLFADCKIMDYKELNATLVDEDA